MHRTAKFLVLAAIGLIGSSGCDSAGAPWGGSAPPAAQPVSRSTTASADVRRPAGDPPSAAARQAAQQDLDAHHNYRFIFDTRSIDGQPLRHQDFAGRILIVDLWATWCPPCRQEVPHFVDLQQRYGDRGLSVIGFNYERTMTNRGAEQTIRKFLSQQPVNYPLALGTPELKVQVPNFRGYPTTLFIDGSGTVRATAVGSRPLEYLEAMVQILLSENGTDFSRPPAAPVENTFVGKSTVPEKAAAVEAAAPLPSPQGTSDIQVNPFVN